MLFLICNCWGTLTDEQQQQQITYEQQQQQEESGYELWKIEQEIYVDWSCCCCCCCCIIFLFLLICNCGGTLTEWTTKNYIWTTTTTTKRSIYIHFLFNFQECNSRRLITLKGFHIVCDHVGQMYPPYKHLVTKSSTMYYIRSAWHLQSDRRSPWHLQPDVLGSDVPP